MKKRICLALIALAFGIPTILHAAPFRIIGTRPAGMGGAFVAISDGAIAQYWNPAGLVTGNTFDFQAPIEVNGEFTKNLLKKADEISSLADDIDSIQAKGGADSFQLADYEKLSTALNKVSDLNEDGLGAIVGLNLGTDFRYLNFAFSYNYYIDASASPFVDLDNVGLVDVGGAINAVVAGGNTAAPPASVASAETVSDLALVIQGTSDKLGIDLGGLTATQTANALINEAASQGSSQATIDSSVTIAKNSWDKVSGVLPSIPPIANNSFDNNKTDITLRGSKIQEFSFGAGLRIPSENHWLSSLSVGGNLKILVGEVGFTRVLVMDEEVGVSTVLDDLTNTSETTTRLTVDLGVMLDRKKENGFKVGLVGKNLTSPSFNAPAGGNAQDFDAQFRMGAAYWLFDRWVFAMDYDLTSNGTALPGFRSQNFGIGTELKTINSKKIDLTLRAGWMKNIAESSSKGIYTLGMGLTVFHFGLDLAGGMATEKVEIDGEDEIPQRFFVSAMASLEW